jgi:hypothetical protein
MGRHAVKERFVPRTNYYSNRQVIATKCPTFLSRGSLVGMAERSTKPTPRHLTRLRHPLKKIKKPPHGKFFTNAKMAHLALSTSTYRDQPFQKPKSLSRLLGKPILVYASKELSCKAFHILSRYSFGVTPSSFFT